MFLLLLVGIGLFYFASAREGFSWFGDAPSYVHHAQNIIEGRPYADIGYVQNPQHFLAPQAYPPGFPLVMTPVIALSGVNVDVLRIENLLFFLLALGVMARLFREDLSLAATCGLVGVVGLHPVFWKSLQRLTPDVLFLLFVYLSLLTYRTALQHDGKAGLAWSLAASFCIYFAFATRTLGVVLLPALLVHDLIRYRRPSRAFLTVAGVGLALFAARALLAAPASSGEDYASLLQSNVFSRAGDAVRSLPSMFLQYVREADNLWRNGYSRPLQHAFFLAAAVPFLVGLGRRLRRRFSVLEAFGLFYLAALLPWTFSKMRYFIPLIPLYYFYIFLGAKFLLGYVPSKRRALATAGLLLVLGVHAAWYTTVDFGPIRPVFTAPSAEAFYAQVRRHTGDGDVLAADYPRQFAFFTDRRAALPYRAGTDSSFFDNLNATGATYLVVGPPEEIKPWHNLSFSMTALVRRHPGRFERVYANRDFQLYRIKPAP